MANHEKKIVGEYKDSSHLLKPNIPYQIRIRFIKGPVNFCKRRIIFEFYGPCNRLQKVGLPSAVLKAGR